VQRVKDGIQIPATTPAFYLDSFRKNPFRWWAFHLQINKYFAIDEQCNLIEVNIKKTQGE
jgi:hypothetical protein